MKNKRPYEKALLKASKELDKYLKWLEDSGRLTSEERVKLVRLVGVYGAVAVSFGHSGESA